MTPPSASVIVPSRGPAERLRKLLDSLASQTVEHETLVVDNGSPGSTVSRLVDAYPFARAVRLERNQGFSAPVNLAAAQASGEALVLVNDDCVVEPDFVERLAVALDPTVSVVMAAGALRDHRHPELIDTAGIELDRTMLVYDYLNGLPLAALEGAPDPIGPSAAAAAFDREAFLAEGGFDERIFAYWEDVDLVVRLRLGGGRCAGATAIGGTHEHSATLGPGSVAKNRLMGYGRAYMLRKWGVVTPSRALPIAAREIPLMLGQAVIDRNVGGVAGRLAGWRDANRERDYPAEVLADGGGAGVAETLRRRYARRRRLLHSD